MPTYIEDDETSTLISTYADLVRTSKTGALRNLLRREVEKLSRRATAQERYGRIVAWLGSVPAEPVEEIPKQHYDWLAGDEEPADLSENLKKELGL